MKAITQKIGFFTAFILLGLVIAGHFIGGWGYYLPALFAFILLPIIDHYSGRDLTNVPAHEVSKRSEEYFYRFVTFIWVWVQLAFLGWCFFIVTTWELSLPEFLGFILGTGIVTGGIGITVAHELGHKKSSLERFYSKLLLMTVCYMHFYIEHNRGHHVTVATPEDPATARYNENVYAFWVRSVVGSYQHAWKLESERLSRNGLPLVGFQNEMIRFFFLPIFFLAGCTLILFLVTGKFNPDLITFFLGQSFVAFSLLEIINYVEHYGITRKEIAPGRYERVNPIHSWNASHLISNFFLFQLQRHSDHHAFAYKRYQVLNHYDESPQLPFGYPTMVLMALVPPLWFANMNPRLETWKSLQPVT